MSNLILATVIYRTELWVEESNKLVDWEEKLEGTATKQESMICREDSKEKLLTDLRK